MDGNRNYITVSELNHYLKSIISAEELLQNMLLMGEISGCSQKGGHLYFTVKDEGGQISACYFNYLKQGYIPKEGEKVLLSGSPDYYGKQGRISFLVRKIQPFGQGNLHVKLEELKERLREEGLFEESRKQPIPRYPQNVLVITSRYGAVIRDIYSTVRKYNTVMNLTLYDVRVQGEYAEEDIANALIRCDSLGFDVIILARGGGSFEDLMPFNSELVARTLSMLNTPVISAVGHETDYSISDFVADRRALTPTAAAEMIAFQPNEEVDGYLLRLKQCLKHREKETEEKYMTVKHLCERQKNCLERKLFSVSNKISELKSAMARQMEKLLPTREKRLAVLTECLSANNPARLLQKGYLLAENKKGIVRSAKALREDEMLRLRFADGVWKVRTLEVEQEGEKK